MFEIIRILSLIHENKITMSGVPRAYITESFLSSHFRNWNILQKHWVRSFWEIAIKKGVFISFSLLSFFLFVFLFFFSFFLLVFVLVHRLCYYSSRPPIVVVFVLLLLVLLFLLYLSFIPLSTFSFLLQLNTHTWKWNYDVRSSYSLYNGIIPNQFFRNWNIL